MAEIEYKIYYKIKFKQMKSTRFSLNVRDFLKGLVLAVVVPVLVTIQESLSVGNVIFDWKTIGISSLAAFVAYLLKNFVTDDIKVAQKTLEVAKEKEIADNKTVL